MGAIGLAGLIAKLALPALLVWGWLSGELGPRALTVFALLGFVVWFGLPRVSGGESFVTSALALIDVALVLAVFKREIRIG
ncbi:MAG TPA: hypothetical protein VI485_22420 [Vicinamibacterales bacterium]|nr:hypothetical protein [Vicinamibacterales bacterium]